MALPLRPFAACHGLAWHKSAALQLPPPPALAAVAAVQKQQHPCGITGGRPARSSSCARAFHQSQLADPHAIKHQQQQQEQQQQHQQQHRQQTFRTSTLAAGVAVAVVAASALSPLPGSALAELTVVNGGTEGVEGSRAAVIFQRSCAGCHAGGGNIIRPGAGLTEEEMQRNGVATLDDIFSITYFGKGRMPGFGEKCQPRGQCTFGPRLSDEVIAELADFVQESAKQGWAVEP